MDGFLQFRAAEAVALDQGYKFRAPHPVELRVRVRRLDLPAVRSGAYRKVRGHQADVFVPGCFQDFLCRFGHADHGKRMGAPDHVSPQHGYGIAGGNQLFYPVLLQPVRHLGHKGGDGLPAAGSVWGPGCISQIQKPFMRHGLLQRAQHAESAYAGINHANGLVFIHSHPSKTRSFVYTTYSAKNPQTVRTFLKIP